MEVIDCDKRIVASVDALDLSCKRKIDLVVLHCSATPDGRDVSAADIRRWHLERGFADIGYHFVVRLDGTVEVGRAIGRTGAHCKGYNRHSIGICYIGGADSLLRSKDTRTPQQKLALAMLLEKIRGVYPDAVVKKHKELSATDCPGF